MSLLTPADVQALGVGVDLATATLQAVIDREEAELTRRFRAPQAAAITETVRPRGDSLYLKRAISTVTSVHEALYIGDPAPALRAVTDYVIWAEEGRIERSALAAGWGPLVTIVYTPPDETSLRQSVLLELVRIATEHGSGGGGSETVSEGGSSVTLQQGKAADYAAARAAQYARLGWLS